MPLHNPTVPGEQAGRHDDPMRPANTLLTDGATHSGTPNGAKDIVACDRADGVITGCPVCPSSMAYRSRRCSITCRGEWGETTALTVAPRPCSDRMSTCGDRIAAGCDIRESAVYDDPH